MKKPPHSEFCGNHLVPQGHPFSVVRGEAVWKAYSTWHVERKGIAPPEGREEALRGISRLVGWSPGPVSIGYDPKGDVLRGFTLSRSNPDEHGHGSVP